MSVPTLGFNLSAKFILHTVVPKWKDGKHQEYELLSSSYLSALYLADEMNCNSIAFPLLAAGNNGFDLELAFKIAQETIEEFEASNKLAQVFLVVYTRDVMKTLRLLNVEVQEEIDEMYVLAQDEAYKLPAQRALGEGIDILQNFLDDGLKRAKEYLNDPQHRREILEIGISIAKEVVDIKKKNK